MNSFLDYNYKNYLLFAVIYYSTNHFNSTFNNTIQKTSRSIALYM